METTFFFLPWPGSWRADHPWDDDPTQVHRGIKCFLQVNDFSEPVTHAKSQVGSFTDPGGGWCSIVCFDLHPMNRRWRDALWTANPHRNGRQPSEWSYVGSNWSWWMDGSCWIHGRRMWRRDQWFANTIGHAAPSLLAGISLAHLAAIYNKNYVYIIYYIIYIYNYIYVCVRMIFDVKCLGSSKVPMFNYSPHVALFENMVIYIYICNYPKKNALKYV